ncbi:hypothetical protein BS47DRAFT_1341632 [Hydnum rufescens UP504]|uniref:Uncharacterized protein n=1 Tax=Hydnum rufescens UP504 TaxID=1448309 RepID=A0A9P6DUT7_9AGAM|nr:hypothetical protein BS47DRAFT_1341632 [Hydnum rufescens UP504]
MNHNAPKDYGASCETASACSCLSPVPDHVDGAPATRVHARRRQHHTVGLDHHNNTVAEAQCPAPSPARSPSPRSPTSPRHSSSTPRHAGPPREASRSHSGPPAAHPRPTHQRAHTTTSNGVMYNGKMIVGNPADVDRYVSSQKNIEKWMRGVR